MSERESDPRDTSWPADTGEFRAAPDASASTAEFRAFVAGGHDETAAQVTPARLTPSVRVGVAVVVGIIVIALAVLFLR